MQRQDLIAFITRTGAGINNFISGIGFASKTILSAASIMIFGRTKAQPMRLRHLIDEVNIAGVQALPVVVLMSAMIGVMLSIQGIYSLRVFGAETQVTFGLALSIPREFAPLITGILVAGRSGSQLTSRVGSMRLNGEIDALMVMGISPTRFVVAPSLLALMISLPVLVAVANLAAFGAAGLYIDATLGIGPQAYWADILSIVTLTDLYHSFGKALIFAILIGAVGISIGMRVAGGADVLGKATTSSVVTCIAAIIAADAIFALVA
ncbi:MAG: MlaE family ABC transporter permease [Candidatus Puniceispirillaceae bacterium]